MRILDSRDRRDYYDGVAFSPTPLFVRKWEEKKLEHICLPHREYIKGYDFYCDVLILGFCGRVYTVYRVYVGDHFGRKVRLESYFGLKAYRERYPAPEARRRRRGIFGADPNVEFQLSDTAQYFEHGKRPIWVITASPESFQTTRFDCPYGTRCQVTRIEYNPMLCRLGFGAVFSAQQAYQELEMYLSNVAEDRKVIPTIDNDLRIESHGFDIKTSFRKPKQGV